MGITGLLPLLKSIQRPCHLRKFAGQTIGVDAYGWLHRGATACAIQLALGQPTTKYVEFAMNRVRMLVHFGITPYIVFDGDYLPSKAATENDRLLRREQGKKLGLELLRLGKTAQAHQELQKAVDVTPEMAGLLIQELKRAKIKYVVAPFEADSQLAFLELQGHIQGIISEDSDLLVFGARCLLTKLDQYGECVMIRRDDFTACREISLVGWTNQDFRRMAILSGCDYLSNIEKMGLKTAHRLLRKHKTIERVLQAVRLEGKLKVPHGYLEAFRRAEMTFLYQWVFCPSQQTLVNLTVPEPDVNVEDMTFIGLKVDTKFAVGVATGDLHPHTKKTLVLPSTTAATSKVTKKPESLQENREIKKNMSIDEFFKAKRQPLAELDPNSFIMTPRQQELARHASTTTWTPSTSRPSANSQVAMSVTASDITSSVHRTIGTPNGSRAKRQRLCQDETVSMETSTIAAAMTGTSKFFSASKKQKVKGSRRSVDFTVFSDDSIDEVLQAIPEPTNTTKVSSAGEDVAEMIVKRATVDLAEETEFVDESQITLVSGSPHQSPQSLHDTEDTFVEENEDLKPDADGSFDKYLMRELKIVHERALKRQIKDDQEARQEGSEDIPNSAWEQAGDLVVIPASDAVEPPPSPIRIHSRHPAHGSEDFIVPESDNECSPLKTRPLNLKQFIFTT